MSSDPSQTPNDPIDEPESVSVDFSIDQSELRAEQAASARMLEQKISEGQAHIAALAHQNRWWKIIELIKGWQDANLPVRGIQDYAAKLKERLDGLEPLIAAAQQSLDQGDFEQALARATYLLQQVADHPAVLKIAEEAKNLASHRTRRRWTITAVAVSSLTVLFGGVIYFYSSESSVIREAEAKIASGDYGAASSALEAMPHNLFFGRRAKYLDANANLQRFISSKSAASESQLERSQELLLNLFAQNESWRETAKADIDDGIGRIPGTAPDVLSRSLILARAMASLDLADRASLAKSLLAKAQQRGKQDRQLALDARQAAYVKQILDWNPTLVGEIIAMVFPETLPPERGVAVLNQWARQEPSLCSTLAANLLPVADKYLGKGDDSAALLLVGAASQLNPRCDTWSFWEKHFRARSKQEDMDGAVRFLGYMVRHNEDSARLREAAMIYRQLRARHPEKQMTPPQEIVNELSRIDYENLIAEAGQAFDDGQVAESRKKLTDAKARFANFFANDVKARRIARDVRFAELMIETRQSMQASEWGAAAGWVVQALEIKPADQDAVDLRDQIAGHLARLAQAAMDAGDWTKAVTHYRQALQLQADNADLLARVDEVALRELVGNAEKAKAKNAMAQAVAEILKARAIAAKAAKTESTESVVKLLDGLASSIVTELVQQSEKDAELRQYDQALAGIALARKLSFNDARLLELAAKIDKLQADPKTANITGVWIAPNGSEFRLVDSGQSIIACEVSKSPEVIKSCTGDWKRIGDGLEGRFQVVYAKHPGGEVKTEGTVRAVIRDPSTLAVSWQDVEWLDPPKLTKWKGKGSQLWQKKQ